MPTPNSMHDDGLDANRRPILTFDFDGVICRPPLGINPGKGIGKSRDKPGSKGLLWRTESFRYLFRGSMPGAIDGLNLLAKDFDCQVLTARSEVARTHTEGWLRSRLGWLPKLNMRPDWHETPAQFKTRMVLELHPLAHFEDDPFTAEWMAELLPAVFLVDWPRNRHLTADNIHRITRLAEAAPTLQGLAARDARVYALARSLGAPLVATLGGGYGRDIEPTIQAHVQVYRGLVGALG